MKKKSAVNVTKATQATMAQTKAAQSKAAQSKAAQSKTAQRKAKAAPPTTSTGETGESVDDRRKQAEEVVGQLQHDYPHAPCALHFQSPVQLLVATILSAQCTDERVNLVTQELFRRYPTAETLATAPLETLETLVQSTGFFRNKAKNIKACCQQLVEKYDGQVPQDLPALIKLAGVGRKTANVVLGTAYGIPTGVVVDTHVGRISRRLGLTQHTDPVRVEQDLMAILPQKEWIDYSHRMIYHGRAVCKARKPLCEACSLRPSCPRIDVD